MSEIKEFESIENSLMQLPRDDWDKVRKILYGSDIQ